MYYQYMEYTATERKGGDMSAQEITIDSHVRVVRGTSLENLTGKVCSIRPGINTRSRDRLFAYIALDEPEPGIGHFLETELDNLELVGVLETFTFAVYPTALDESFESFEMDVPSMSGEDFAARHAWWQTFHLLGARGFEPEEFTVCGYRDGVLGRIVTSGGYTDLVHAPRGTAAA